jgi:FtsH-binding integral membrane protein
MSGVRIVGGRLVRPGGGGSNSSGPFTGASIDPMAALRSFFNELPISWRSRRYLATVYGALVVCVSFAFLGALADYFLHIGGLLTMLASFGLVLFISSMSSSSIPPSASSSPPAYTVSDGGWRRRTAYSSWVKGVPNAMILLCALCFCQGSIMQPILAHAIQVHALIVPAALILTAILFLCLALSALFVSKRAHMALAALSSSTLSMYFCMSVMSSVMPALGFGHMYVVLGLVGFCLYIIADTQRMIANADSGQLDYVFDAMMLFLHVLPMFVRLVTFITQYVQEQQATHALSQQQQGDGNGRRRAVPVTGIASGAGIGGLGGFEAVANVYQQFGR